MIRGFAYFCRCRYRCSTFRSMQGVILEINVLFNNNNFWKFFICEKMSVKTVDEETLKLYIIKKMSTFGCLFTLHSRYESFKADEKKFFKPRRKNTFNTWICAFLHLIFSVFMLIFYLDLRINFIHLRYPMIVIS